MSDFSGDRDENFSVSGGFWGRPFGIEKENVSDFQVQPTWGKGANADLWALKILHDGNGLAHFFCAITDRSNQLGVELMGSMAEVQTCDIHALFDQTPNAFRRASGRT